MQSKQLPGTSTKAFGQFEPLTRRLHNLLKEYKDGLSVPKELIQNAEDAGATEVLFLYDERQNLNARTNLLSNGLEEFQGPALWAYNNKPFTENDFENIRKLGGATKEEDTTKVGKFGLGFNSVYNLTDLPSFITGNQAVIFDPHGTHLGELGLSTDLKSETDNRWKNQLKPYEGVFGCRLNSPGKICEGVLFRFPLRTSQQAQKSDIKDLSYSDQEMKNFFTVFAKYAGSLLLFTQNVLSVGFYFLPESEKPENGMKLVDIRKNTVYKQLFFDDISEDANHMNILEYSSDVLGRKSLHDHQYIEEKNKIQVTFAKHAYNVACNLTPMINQTTWLVTWSVGDKRAQRFATDSQLKGLVPLAAVAIPLKTTDANTEEICIVSDCRVGFYQNGHLFCFMPLPIETKHNIHINATFALTPDRRQLCIKNTDDTDSDEADWNQILETHVIGQAWAYALQNLSGIDVVDEATFYELWPDVSNFKDTEGISRSFYTQIIQRNLKIFCRDNGKKWSSYTEMLLLDPSLRNNETVGTISLSVFKRYVDGVRGWVIDLPSKVLHGFERCGLQDKIKQRSYTKENFFKTMFFPHVTDIFLSAEDRNKLISYALLSTSEQLQEMLKVNRCIPTKPHGTMKNPSELVSPRGQCAGLYLEEEEVFPDQFFCNHLVLKALEKLGMTVDELSSQKLVARATVIQARKKVCLVKNLLNYLNRNPVQKPSQRRFEGYHDVQKTLQSTKILPVLQIPIDWPFKWKGTAGSFAAPSGIYHSDLMNLVGCCEVILDNGDLEMTTSASDVFKWLGIKSKTDVQPETVVNQLRCLSSGRENTSDESLRKVSTVCHEVYRYLDKYCVMVKQGIKKDKIQLFRNLSTHPVVLSAYRLIEPQMIAIHLIVPLKPYLYSIGEDMYQLYPHFLKAVGIREYFEVRDILNVMTAISHAALGGPLRGENLKCFCRAVHVLVDVIGREESSVPEVLLPNIDGHLYLASKLCLNDCGWIHDQKHMLFLHPDITPKDGQTLGARTKREASLAKHITAIPQAKGFGQHEPLTSRLKRILDGYPKDVSILKELLQNADDAGATELMFIKDFRFHKTEKVFGEEWKQLQGPALCVYNNSHFREEDFIGIQSLGEGSKGQDPSKTGQYGVGFNVVYHLTDVPSFMTVGPGTEKTLCVLDPHQCYTPRTEEDTPGIQFKDLNVLRETYNDVFPCFLEDSVMKTQKGTLFRFPLRTDDMADKSKISRHKTIMSEIEEMLKVFKDEAFASILFLTSVNKLSIASVSREGKLVIEHTVEAFLQNADHKKVLKYISTLKHDVSQNDLGSITPFQIQIKKTLKGSRTEKQDWLIVHQVGFDRSLPLPTDLKLYWTTGEIKLLPRGGVAVSLNQAHNTNGRLFCVLPLPKETGLPIHINGQFVLGHEARRDLWQGTSDYRTLWNEHIVKAIICPAYIAALKTLQTLNFPQDGPQSSFDAAISSYRKLFPVMEKTNDAYTKVLVKSFYTAVGVNHIPLFPVLQPKTGHFLKQPSNAGLRVEWVPVVSVSEFPGYFNIFSHFLKERQSFYPAYMLHHNQSDETPAQKDRRMLAWVLKDLGMKIIEAWPDIQRQFENTDFKDTVKGTSPDVVISFLRSIHDENGCHIGVLPQSVFDTPLQSVGNVKLLIQFCQMEETFVEKMTTLPLVVTQSHILDFLSEKKQYIVTTYTDLLPQSANELLHESLVHLYKQLDLTKSKCLKSLDIRDLSQLLEDNLDKSLFKTGRPTPWLEAPSQLWICRLWEFLWSQVDSQVTKLRLEGIKTKEEDIAISLLSPLGSWSLIPAFLTQTDLQGNLTKTPLLYPVETSRHVIGLDNNSNDDFANILMKLCLPKLMSSTFVMKDHVPFSHSLYVCSLLVADMRDPKCMLEALSKTSGMDSHLSVYECSIVLYYFDGNMAILKKSFPNLSQKLRSLSYFPSISGTPVCINGYDKVHCVKDGHPYTPEAGLQYLFSILGRTVIIHKFYYERILIHLKLPYFSRERMYTEIILPNLMVFTFEDRMKHLLHIRDNIVQNTLNPSIEMKDLLNRLTEIPFIVNQDGQRHKASEFYSIKVAEFRTMCSSNDFLPSPFNEDEWQPLLELLGLKYQISVDDFVQFATKLEQDSGRTITEQAAFKSKLLVKHLQGRTDLIQEGLLRQIRHVRFLLPCDIEVEEEDGASLKDIHSQYGNARSLVSYSESCDPVFYHSIWTSSSMWTKDADICRFLNREDAETARAQLDISKEPAVEVLVKHLQNISCILKEKDVVFKKERSSLMKTIFTNIYQLLQKHKENVTMSDRLQLFPTVYIVDQCEVVSANDVVIDLLKGEDIPGYIFRAPTVFGNFFGLFEALGAQKVVTANTYALVMQKLFQKTRGKRLNPNELRIVTSALFNLITCFFTEERAQIHANILYLPNAECILSDSKSLVYVDNNTFQERLGKNMPLNYFLGFEAMKIKMHLIPEFPEKYKMVPLTAVVKETLSPSCLEKVAQCGNAINYEQKIQSLEFVKGILRICYHTHQELSENDASRIEDRLGMIKIRQVEGLETVLVHNGNNIDESKLKRECYIMETDFYESVEDTDQSVTVYLSSIQTKESNILFSMTLAIDRLTSYRLGCFILAVEKMLVIDPEDISALLDERGVKTYTRANKTAGNETVYPRAGTLIPDELHWMLDNSFTWFDEGEYVGLDVFDPFADDSQSHGGGHSLPVYVYAIVVKVEDDTSPMAATYLVEAEEEVTKIVSATLLYKFHREKSNTTTDVVPSYGNIALDYSSSGHIDNILEDIRCQLQGAWDRLNPTERRRVRLRLLSKWHPDRNPGKVELCTEVCQYIGLYIQQLEYGRPLDLVDARQTTFDSSFYDEVTRRTNLHQTFRESSGSRSYASCHQAARRQAYPHLGEAQRWFQTAKRDLDAARQAMSAFTPGNYNWICYISHQAGEKALKAVVYTLDSLRADELKVHNLPEIASGLDSNLQELARKLQGNDRARHNRMRYPDRSAYPRIPGDEYTRPDAEATITLSEMIISIASQKLEQ